VLNNIRHERFALGIAQGKPASTAYADAGYKARGNAAEASASKLLRNPKVKARVEQLAAELTREAIATAEEVQQLLTVVARGEYRPGEEVLDEHVTPKGLVVSARVSWRERIKALELLGRARGVFLPASAGDGELDALARALESPVPVRVN